MEERNVYVAIKMVEDRKGLLDWVLLEAQRPIKNVLEEYQENTLISGVIKNVLRGGI